MKKLILLLFITLSVWKSIAQTLPSPKEAVNPVVDSLQKVLKTTIHDTIRINTLISLARENINSGNNAQAFEDANNALALINTLSYSTKCKEKFLALDYNVIGNINKSIGDYAQALEFYLKSLKIRKETSDKKGIAASYNNIGSIHLYKGDYAQAIEYYLKSLQIREEIGDKKGMANSYNNIGSIHSTKGDYSKALEFHLKSLKIKEEIGDKNGMADSYHNIGNIYYQKDNYVKALEFHLKSLKIYEETGNMAAMARGYHNIGVIHKERGDKDKVLECYLKSLKIRQVIKDKLGMAVSYLSLGDLYFTKNNLAEAQFYQQKSLSISREIDALPDMMNAYSGLARTDSALGNFKEAYSNYKLYTAAKDSIFSEEANKKAIQSEMNFEFEKKEAMAKAEQEKKDAIALEELQQQKMQRNGFIGGFALMLAMAGVSYKSFRNKRKANTQLAIKNTLIEEKQKEILDSINYAKRIQNAILPPNRIVKEHLPDSFILYKPKDIVAGDFYWLEYKNGQVLFAAADCTGHGVPGAMVSVICNNGLNRSVREHNITDPGKILDKTKEIVIAEFEKSDEEVKDGMDISLCAFNKTTHQILWAGANNPLWVIRNNEIIELKPDKQPIGKYSEGKPFTTHSMQLQKGDLFYIFTDGYADQFGGEKGKKFKSAKLKELLLSISNEPMNEQKRILEENFETWKGSLEQVDDVCIIGVRI